MAVKDRIQTIKQMVANDEEVITLSLSGTFQVTEETTCRDLEKLEDEGLLTRIYGGAVLSIAMLTEDIHFYKRALSFYEKKQLIAREAPSFIDNGTTMATDSSSTVVELLKLLQNRSDLTLLTNPAEAIHVLVQSEIKVVSTGGESNKDIPSLQGRIIKEIINCHHADIMVISCKGFDINSGTLDFNEVKAEVKRTMIRQATEVALLANHPKLDRRAFIQLAGFSHVSYIVADKSPGAERIAFCKDNSIQLVW